MKKSNVFLMVTMVAMFCFSMLGLAQEAGQAAGPVDGVVSVIDKIGAWIAEHMSVIMSVLGFVWMLIVKLVSNEKAGAVVVVMQKWTDGLAKLVIGVGKLMEKLAEILGELVKSDGVLGKK